MLRQGFLQRIDRVKQPIYNQKLYSRDLVQWRNELCFSHNTLVSNHWTLVQSMLKNPFEDRPMVNVNSDNKEFKKQTPSTFKWSVGASGIVAAAAAVSGSVAPEAAGYALAALILFILLMIIVVNLEIGTAARASASPLAQNAQLQVKVLSWFATVALIVGAASIISSFLFAWPLPLAIVQDTTSKKFLKSIKRYDLERSSIERVDGGAWQEKSQKDKSIVYKFTEDGLTAHFLTLSDNDRRLKLRVPTRGGMVEWSVNEKFKDCDDAYCWGDVGHATMFR